MTATIVLGAAGLALAASLLAHLRNLAAAGAGYKAKTVASAWWADGREIPPNSAPEVSEDAYFAMRLFPARVDRARGVVACGGRRAVRRPGRGASLAYGPLSPMPDPVKIVPQEWPRGAASPALERLAEAAFEEPNAKRLRRTRAVLIAKDGKLVCERYAPGIAEGTPLPGWSMTKSVFGALTGVLVGEGKLSLSGDGLLPEWRGDGRAAITIEDLLRMRSGLRFSELYAEPLSDVVRMLFREPDAARFAASRPLAARPGARWQYSSGTSNILSRVMRDALGDAAYGDFPRRALFEPLGMSGAVLEADASGTFVASSFMHAPARDWLKLGELYRLGGAWKGRRVLPEGWTDFCAAPTPQSPGRCYGAHWWRRLARELGGDTPAAARLPADCLHALGHEGQCLSVVPSRGLVVLRLGLSIYIDAWNHAQFLADALENS